MINNNTDDAIVIVYGNDIPDEGVPDIVFINVPYDERNRDDGIDVFHNNTDGDIVIVYGTDLVTITIDAIRITTIDAINNTDVVIIVVKSDGILVVVITRLFMPYYTINFRSCAT